MELIIGERNVWNSWEPFGLSVADRRHHVLLLGKTGMGKSTLFRNMLVQDIAAGRGCLFIDRTAMKPSAYSITFHRGAPRM